MLAQPDDSGDVLGVLVSETLHQDLLVGPPRPDLQPLQVEQLLEDAPLDLVPREGGWSTSVFIFSCIYPGQDNIKVASAELVALGLGIGDKNSLSEVILHGLSDGNRSGF